MAIFCFTNQIKIYMLIMSFCFIHELGHIIMGRILGMQLEKIEIGPCGFSSSFIAKQADFSYEIKKRNNFELKKIIVAITGPIISLILVMIFTYIEIPYITKQEAVYSNILIIIFNLLPLYPLDGGRILKGILYIPFICTQKIRQMTDFFSFITIFSLIPALHPHHHLTVRCILQLF